MLTVFQSVSMLNSIEPMKVFKIKKLANQPMFRGALEISTIIFRKARKPRTLVVR